MVDPYRPQGPAPDPELARLAMQGQQRRMQAAAARGAEEKQAHGHHLKVAIGAFRGSLLKRMLLLVIILCLLTGVAGIFLVTQGQTGIGEVMIPWFIGAFVCFMIWVFVPPIASSGAIAIESFWATSLPFQLVGYFETLSAQPRYACTLTYEISWQPGARPPDPNLLHGILGVVDPPARVDYAHESGARIIHGPISGSTGITVNRVPVYRNHKLPGSVHALVEQVLLPLHRSHPIGRVSVSRG